MKAGKKVSCREARKKLQEYLDSQNWTASGETANLERFMPHQLREHLEQCPDCSFFWQDLSGFAPALKDQLDLAVQQIPSPDIEGIVSRQAEQEPLRPTPKPALALRWAALSLAGLLLIVFVGLQIRENIRTRRAIEREIERIVETLYREPLLPGVESALVRYRYFSRDDELELEQWLESSSGGDLLY
jgi:predicted anti-sigma-YlaC factor YlaD